MSTENLKKICLITYHIISKNMCCSVELSDAGSQAPSRLDVNVLT